MARKYGRLVCGIWDDKEYHALSLADQGLFAGLLAYPYISWCGVIDYIPARLVKLAAELTPRTLAEGVGRLIDAGLIRWDQETQELLIRRFMHHDGVLQVKNVGKAMVTAYGKVNSEYLQECIVLELGRIWTENADLKGWEGVNEMAPDFMVEIVDAATC